MDLKSDQTYIWHPRGEAVHGTNDRCFYNNTGIKRGKHASHLFLLVRVMNHNWSATKQRLRPQQGQSLEEGRYVGVSKNWCHCPCAPWNVDLELEAADPPDGWTNMACFYSVCKEDQCARQCHMLLLSSDRRRQSLGSAGIYFQWKWRGQQPGHKCFDLSGNQPCLDWVNLRLWEKCAGVQDAPGACNTHSAVKMDGS